MPILSRDFETRSAVDLEEVGAWRYSTHPSTDIIICGFCVDDGPVQFWHRGDPPPKEFIAAASDPDWIATAFNESFERAIELNILIPRYSFPRIPDSRRRCLQMSALALALPARLEKVAAALGLGQQKDKDGRKVMLEMSRPRKPLPDEDPNGVYWHEDEAHVTRLEAYCGRDVETERELYHRIKFISPAEQELADLSTTINDRGVHIDVDLLSAALKIAKAAKPHQLAEFHELIGGEFDKPLSPKLVPWLAERGCKVRNLQASTLAKALARPNLPANLRRVLELRMTLAQTNIISKLETMLVWCNSDDRIRWAFRHHGASTGRATSLGVQLHNMKKPGDADLTAAVDAIATGDYETVRRQFKEPTEIIGAATRAMITAAPGSRLLIADLSGIESRLTAYIAGEKWKLEQWAKFDRTGDPKDEPYFIIGTKYFKLPEEHAREPGKTGDLAFAYMGGAAAWFRFAPTDETLGEAEANKRKMAWRMAHPETVKFWGRLNRAAIRAVQQPGKEFSANTTSFIYCKERGFLFMRLPNGRELAYPSPKLKTTKFGKRAVVFMDSSAGKWVECRHGHVLMAEPGLRTSSKPRLATSSMRR
jgi:DNA polymerase